MIWFFWDGGISETRLRIMQDCIYSTKHFNPTRKVILLSNTLNEAMFPKYEIEVRKWDESIFDDTPIPVEVYRQHYIDCHPREKSDMIRMLLLYKYGGSYIDTDDICFREMTNEKNVVCRSYDPHTAWYNKIEDKDCVSGKWREFRGYDNINMFPRNDCWQNFEPKNPFLHDLLSDPRIVEQKKEIYIFGDFSWQMLINEYLKKHLPLHNVKYGLTLVYLYEGHVSASSVWDMGHFGGEMHDLWRTLPSWNNCGWGQYKCTKEVALDFMTKILSKYPYASHLWLHDKDANEEWLNHNPNTLNSISTWIINEIRANLQ